MAFFDDFPWKNGLADFHEIFRVCLSCEGLVLFKIGLENRDFCKSLHFYIVDAGKQIFQSLKNDSAINFSTLCLFYWFVN